MHLSVLCSLVLAIVNFPKFSEAIVRGDPAENGQFPWMVAIYYHDFICGGSIISETAILTAAHCILIDGILRSADDFYGVVGDVDKDSPNAIKIYFTKVSPHPDFNGFSNDLAIMETSEPIALNDKMDRICLASPKTSSLIFRRVVAMGWGESEDNITNSITEGLQYSNEIVIPNLKCYFSYFGSIELPPSVMCAEGLKSGICSGDSGGPLIHSQGSRPIQVGISAFVNNIRGCGALLSPSGFTRVSSFNDFISSTATGDVCFA